MAKSYEKTIVDDKSFDSKSEAEFYIKIKKAKKEGKIKDFDISPMYILLEEFNDWRGHKSPSMKHYPDYLITLNDGSQIVVDTKGGSFHETDAKLKRKLWMDKHRDIPYYYVSECSKFIGGQWVETSSYFDFNKKLRDVYYKKLYLHIKRATATSPKLNVCGWDKWFVYHEVAGLFYVWEKTYTKKDLEKMEKLKEKK